MDSITGLRSTVADIIKNVLLQTIEFECRMSLLDNLYRQLLAASRAELIGGNNEFAGFGLKLSSQGAADCLLSVYRTTKYWLALCDAITAIPKSDNIRICYPGSGPFASLILPLVSRFPDRAIEIVVLDVNPNAIDNARDLWAVLAPANIEITFLLCNSLEYISKEKFDIIIFECLIRGLQDEAQVAITLHMSTLLKDKGQLIPERIECKLTITCLGEELAYMQSIDDKSDGLMKAFAENERKNAITLLSLDKFTRQRIKVHGNSFHCGIFDISALSKTKEWVITTVLYLGEYHVLYEYQCGLTVPLALEWEEPFPSKFLKVDYCLRPRPGFVLTG